MSKRKKHQQGNQSQMADIELREFIQSTDFKSQTQKELYESILRNDIVFCSGVAGCGKAQPLSSMILTHHG